MRTTLIALLAVALIASTAVFLTHHQTESENLQKIHIGHLHIKVHWDQLGNCAGVLTGAAKSCGAAISSEGANIVGDIGCVKHLLHANSCGHIF